MEIRTPILAFAGMDPRLPPSALRLPGEGSEPAVRLLESVNTTPDELPTVVPRQVPRFGHEDTSANTIVPFQKGAG